MIRHLRNELEEVKKSCEKYEQLNATMTILENSLKAIKEEKDADNDEAQFKLHDLAEKSREAERMLIDLREEHKDAERAASEAKVHYDRISSDLMFAEDKENSLQMKINNIAAYLDELSNNQASLKDGVDIIKKEVAELKSNISNIEREQIAAEERNSKLSLTKRNHQTLLAELEGAEKRLLQQRADKENERNQLKVLLDKKDDLVEDLSNELGQLEDQDQEIVTERRKIQEATQAVSEKRQLQEVEMTQIRAEINNLESKTKNIEDEYRTEEQGYNRAADSLNDQKDRNEKLVRENDKFKSCLFSLEELGSKVVFCLLAASDIY